MNPRENLCAALEGQIPARIPFTVNDEFISADPAWDMLFAAGLCRIPYCQTVRARMDNEGVEVVREDIFWHGSPAKVLTYRTLLGEIRRVSVANWTQEYFLKTPADYRVMEYVVRHTRLALAPAVFATKETAVGDRGLTLVGIDRTPLQTILVDYAGLENFAYHLAEGFPELFALAEALEEQLLERCRLAAQGPGRYLSLVENFTAVTWGPERFRRYHLPVYAKILPILYAAGKKVFPHFDGKIAGVVDLLAGTEFAGIESLTEPPEGDLTLAQARATMPDKVFWANINVGLYALPEQELRQWLRCRIAEAAPDRRRLAFEISEDLPANWAQAIPVVLEECG